MTERTQINPWIAIKYAVEILKDDYDRFYFLQRVLEDDLEGIGQNSAPRVVDSWPEFVKFHEKEQANARR